MIIWGAYTMVSCTVNFVALPIFLLGVFIYYFTNEKEQAQDDTLHYTRRWNR